MQSKTTEVSEEPSSLETLAMLSAIAGISARISRPSGAYFEVSPVPLTLSELKGSIEERLLIPRAMQRLLSGETFLDTDKELKAAVSAAWETGHQFLQLTIVVDESPLRCWDFAGNPDRCLLEVFEDDFGSHVIFQKEERCDYVNVLTREPVVVGAHFFEFVMHSLLDEQWCGVTAEPTRAGYGGCDEGWFYYCAGGLRTGRRSAALHAPRERAVVRQFEEVKSGDIIGMFLDLDQGALAFLLNGRLQGACRLPSRPLFVTTSVDRREDHVELRKPPLADLPRDLVEFLSSLRFRNDVE